MVKDSGTKLTTLQVDGGMTVNNLLMQLQADLTGISVGVYKILWINIANVSTYILYYIILIYILC